MISFLTKKQFWAADVENNLWHDGLLFKCPGCKHLHLIPVKIGTKEDKFWNWNGSLDAPNLIPSVKNTVGPFPDGHTNICHFHLVCGVIQFCGDCTHELKNQNVPLPELTEKDIEYYK